jgi:Zn-dependent protease with chaperone function
MARYDALYAAADGEAPPIRVTVTLGEATLDIRDPADTPDDTPEGVLVAQWAYATLRPVGPVRPGQALVLLGPGAAPARLTLLDGDILWPLADRAPQAVRRAGGRDSLLGGCVGGPLAGCGLGCLLITAMPAVLGLAFGLWTMLPDWFPWGTAGDLLRGRIVDWAAPALTPTLTPVLGLSLPETCDHGDGPARLDALTDRLAAAGGLDDPPRSAVLDAAEPLAFVLGDRLYLTRGLLGALDSGDHLAAVLAHGLGHLAQGDRRSLDSRRDESGWTLTAAACATESDALEADAWALRALRRGGLRADGLGAHLRSLPADERGGPWATYLCLHPVTAERLRALRTTAPEGGASALTAEAWHAVQAICGAPPSRP